MAVAIDKLLMQVTASTKALDKLTSKERESNPTKSFADNYNTLLELAKETLPEVDTRQWPPQVEIHTPSMGLASAKSRYAEIHSFLHQIESILGANIELDNFGLA